MMALHPCKFGSMEEAIVLLSRAICEAGGRSIVVFKSAVPPALQPFYQVTGTTTEVLASSSRGGTRVAFYRGLFRLIRKYRPDVVHVHFHEQFSILPVLLAMAGVPRVVFTDHYRVPSQLSSPTRLQLRLWNLLVPPVFGTTLLAVSDHVKRTLIRDYKVSPRRVRTVRNGVNPQRFRPGTAEDKQKLRAAHQLPTAGPIVLTVAALVPEKGVGDLLTAARHVLAACPDATFLVIGEGSLAGTLRDQAREAEIEKNLRFLGMQGDVSDFMRLADVVVVPSVWQEPAGLATIEAMASGRPVVATRVGGIPEYLGEGAGILVEPKSPQQMASAIVTLLQSPSVADSMGHEGRRIVEQQFSLDRWVDNILDVYEICRAPRAQAV